MLFVHGASDPSDTMFDLEIDGESWMEAIAARGFDVCAMDVRGYGRSTRPPEMDQPPGDNAPVVTIDEGVRDFGAVVEHTLQEGCGPLVTGGAPCTPDPSLPLGLLG